MAIDKAIDSLQLDADLTAVADAIRTKGGTSEALTFPDGFVDAVAAIEAGGGGGEDLLHALLTNNLTSYSNNDITQISSGTFRKATNLKILSLPNLTSIKPTIDAFTGCGITEAYFPKMMFGGDSLFEGCASLTSVNLPEYTNNGSSQRQFYACKKLETAILPKMKYLVNAFNGCTVLKKVDLGVCEAIKNWTFDNCHALEALIIRTSTMCTLSATLPSITSGSSNYIYVPSVLVDTYKAGTNWSRYADQIRAIEDYPEITGG